jgi:hypothetical protein
LFLPLLFASLIHVLPILPGHLPPFCHSLINVPPRSSPSLIRVGHFHAVADIDKLKEEVSAEVHAPTSKISLILPRSGTLVNISAAITPEAIYARGHVDRSVIFVLREIHTCLFFSSDIF